LKNTKKNNKLQYKNILLISPEPWNHLFVSKHHYATHLAARGNKVYFLNPPTENNSCKTTQYKNVYTINYTGFMKGLAYLPGFIKRNIILKKFQRIQQLCNTKFDLVWSFDNSVFYDFSALPQAIFSISHIVDWNQDFRFANASRTADLCLSTSGYLKEKQKLYNKDSYNIGHGFYRPTKNEEPLSLPGNNAVKCGYAGNLDIKYIDWPLIDKLASSFPKVDFHFAGSWKESRKFEKIRALPNFFYHGVLKSKELEVFYKSMDILILIYLNKKYPEQLANPHKMMEYLGSGKAIVGTWTAEYKPLAEDGIIKMATNTDEFIAAFQEVKNNLTYWNSEKLMESRGYFADQNTYKKQIEKIENLL